MNQYGNYQQPFTGNSYGGAYPNYGQYGQSYYDPPLPPQQQQMAQRPQQRQMPQVIGGVVTNVDEAKAYRVETLDTYVFFNQGANEVYVKRILDDGTAPLQVFKSETQPPQSTPQQQQPNNFDGINTTLQTYSRFINQHDRDIETLKAEIESLKGARENVEPTRTAKSNKSNAKPDVVLPTGSTT